jgi:xylulokinase
MKSAIHIGIDLGTTVLKAAAYDGASGRRLAICSRRLALQSGPDGRREQNPAAIVRSLGAVMRGLRSELGPRRWNAVEGLGLAAQGGSTIVCDEESGRPLTPMFLWNDYRCFPWFAKIAAMHAASYWRRFSLRDEPGVGLGRISWLRERDPSLFRPGRIYSGAGELVYRHMTGAWRQDACNALQTGCYDARREALIAQPLSIVGLTVRDVAPLRRGHETHPLRDSVARQWALAAGLPVAGPYNDHEAGYLSACHVSKSPLQCSLGTAWVGNFVTRPGAEGHQPIQLVVPAPTGEGRMTIQPLLTGNVTWDWALETWVARNHKRALSRQAGIFSERLLPPPGLMALPWLNRPNPLMENASGGAVLFGIGPATGKDDLVRAVAAGMCHEFARMFRPLQKAALVDSLALGGGASKGNQFRRQIAALFDPLPVHQFTDQDESGTRGCLYALSRQVARADVRRVEAESSLDRGAVAEAHRLYLELYDRLYGRVNAGRAYTVPTRRSR